MADHYAKEAAGGKTSSNKDLPIYLRKPLPANLSASRQAHHEKLKTRWVEKWKASSRYERINKIDKSIPSPKFIKATDQTGMNGAGLIFQLRSGHLPLNEYLHRFNIDTGHEARCPKCEETKETVYHFLMECPAYAAARRKAHFGIHREPKNLKFLLGNEKGIKKTLKFVGFTERFGSRYEKWTRRQPA